MPSSSDTLEAFLTSGHKAVYGKTGSGKSQAGKFLYDHAPGVGVFITPHDDLPRGERCRTPTEVRGLIARRVKRIVWRAPKEREVEGGREEAVHRLGVLTGELLTVGRRLLKGDKAEPWCTVFIDECHNFTSKTGYIGPVEELLSEGRKYGIRVVLMSQRPARVSLEVLGQADVVILLKLAPPDAGYLQKAGYPVAEFEAWTDQPFHFVLMRDKKWVAYNPLPV